MALAPSLLVTNGNNADLTSYATASITPTAPVLAFLDYSRNDSVQPVVPTLSGAKATWTLIGLDVYYKTTTGTSRISCGAWIGTGASSASAVTINFAGVTHSGVAWTFIDLIGAASSPVVQSKSTATSPGNGASITATLDTASPAGPDNRCFSGTGFNSNLTTAVGDRASWSRLSAFAQGTPSEGVLAQWRSDVFEVSGSAVNSSGGGMAMGLIVVEIAAAAAAGGVDSSFTLLGVS